MFDSWVISEDANIGSWPQGAKPVDQFDIVGLKEDKVRSDLER